MTRPLLQLIHAPDGAALAAAIAAGLASHPRIEVQLNPPDPPPPERPCLLTFVLTPAALTDPAVARLAALAAPTLLPQLAVVPVHADFAFGALPASFAHLKTLNAVGWDQGTAPGERALDSIRKLLGLTPFKDDCRVFISYRRSDGAAVARALYAHLSDKGYRAFLDTETLEGGVAVQAAIHAAIPERDFLLLVNSPDAYGSTWVQEEIEVALNRQVTVLVLDLPGAQRFPLLRDLPGLPWDAADPDRLARVEAQVAARLATRWGFDQRVRQCLHALCGRRDLTQQRQPQSQRQLILATVGQPVCLIHYEDAAPGLDRLYQLHLGRTAERKKPAVAILVHNGLPLTRLERAAVEWAAARRPLRVLAVEELTETLEGMLK